MEFLVIYILVPLLLTAAGFVITYFIIKAAVINGQRHARREAYVEDFLPEQATWLSGRQREELKAHAARLGRV
ncbi:MULTISPECIES: hypothetical protein [Microbacterium]|uniref:hypothetical protein n=1 Tax=Microbacterium TaxID=33882 RepID=UPI000C52CE50|nr:MULTISPECIES: hypothetical protein [Microbacterium]MAB81789.1 hypothetical protein [Planctomycetota bacterium]MAM54895.1 hypothetical protein [Microbacterium sp.]|tara:strand:+ start:67 stop:285 length:219 start_codon:yes stop_codon:yes gene_type:complete